MNLNISAHMEKILNIGLYQKELIDIKLYKLIGEYEEGIRLFCPQCGGDSIFKKTDYDVHGEAITFRINPNLPSINCIYPFSFIEYSCQLNDNKLHKLYVLLNFNLTHEKRIIMQKVGQTPSLAEIQQGQHKKYHKVLDELGHDYSKATGLFAHGVGAGSLVYLRRVFEQILERSHIEAKASDGWDDEAYNKSRVPEKIDKLAEFLPSMVVESGKHLYPILSKGIHELNEDECKKYFPLLRTCTEIILDEQIRKQEEAKRREEVKNSLAAIKGELK